VPERSNGLENLEGLAKLRFDELQAMIKKKPSGLVPTQVRTLSPALFF